MKMKVQIKVLLLLLLLVIPLFLTSCRDSEKPEGDLVLRVHNWQAYIDDGKDDNGVPRKDENGNLIPSVIKLFEDYYYDKYQKKVQVIYTTYETNEEMLNSVKAGGQKYDLVCPSDYIIQKMISDNLLEEFTINDDKYTNIPNYDSFVSPYLLGLFKDRGWDKYAVNYMWGTMGFVYDPEVVDYNEVSTWDALWNPTFKNKITVKDSVRDTYTIGVLHVYKDDLLALRALYERDEDPITAFEYNVRVNEILNRKDDETIAKVEAALKELKNNVFSFEVDSGKNDIVTGKVNINLAWSGDAVFAIDAAMSENNKVLKYALPEEASNIWFDAWVMPKGANKLLAEEFLDFISQPEIASKNMDYIGYTSAIAGDEIMDLVEELYGDDEGDEIVDLSYFFEGTLTDSSRYLLKTNSDLLSQLIAQYPDKKMIPRLGIMEDFGEQNDAVIAMWQRIKANAVSVWIYLIVAIIIIGLVALYFYTKQTKKMRIARQKAKITK